MKYYKIWTADLSAPVLIIKAESLDKAIATAKYDNPTYTLGEEYKQANKCHCYRREQIKEKRTTLTGQTYYADITVGVCYNTVNRPWRVKCSGQRDKCQLSPKET